MRKNSIKNIRINEEVMRELSNIIRGEIKDPRINPMTSVVAVEVAPDLKTAKALNLRTVLFPLYPRLGSESATKIAKVLGTLP